MDRWHRNDAGHLRDVALSITAPEPYLGCVLPRSSAHSDAPVPVDSLGASLDFMRLLWAIDHGLEQTSHRMERELGVTGPQRLVIRIVGRRPGIAPSMLARTMHVHPGTLTGVLQRLIAKELLERIPDPADGRRSHLRLTSVGEAIDRHRAGTVEARVQAALRALPDSNIETARRVLIRIAAALDCD